MAMNETQAIKALAALAQEHRLRIFRLLVCKGANGLPASAIADAVGVSRTSASFHLKELEQAGLVHSWRESRNIRYALTVEGMRGLITFLTEECCEGRSELCGNFAAALDTAYCGTREEKDDATAL